MAHGGLIGSELPPSARMASSEPDGSAAGVRSSPVPAEPVKRDHQIDLLLAALGGVEDGVSLFDAELALIACNRRFLDMLGLPVELGAPGTRLREILAYQAARGDFGTGEQASVEYRLRTFWRPEELEIERQYHRDRTLRLRRRPVPGGGFLTVYSDVTEARAAEAALKASEQRLRDFAEAASDWLWEWDTDRRFTWFSARIAHVLGRPLSFFLGKRREEIGRVVTADPAWRRNLEDIAARLPFRDFRYASLYPDGMRWFAQSGKPIYAADGTFLGYRGTGREITAEVLAEQQARDARDRLADAIAAMPYAVANFDREGRMVAWNDAYRKMHVGIEHLFVVGTPFELLLRAAMAVRVPEIPPDEQEDYVARRMAYHRDPQGSFERPLPGGIWQEILESRLPDGSFLVIIHDITARKRAEADANLAQAQLAAAIDGMPSVIGVFDPQDRLVTWNRAYAELLARNGLPLARGMTFEQLVRNSVSFGRIEVAESERESYIAQRLAFHANPAGSFERQFADGTWQELHEYRLPDGGLILLMNDITERKHAETALRASEQRYRDFAEAASDWLWQWDAAQRLTFVSERVTQVLGEPVEYFLGRSRDQLAAVEMEPDQRAAYESAIAARQSFRDIRYRLSLPNGRSALIASSGKPMFAPDGTFLGYRGTGRDITATTAAAEAAHRAQARLAAAIEGLPQAVAMYDAGDRLVSWNRAFADMYGEREHLLRVGVRFEDLLRAGLDHGVLGSVGVDDFYERRMALHRNPQGALEHRLTDGRWREITEYHLRDGDKLVMVSDITERRNSEDALRRSEQRLSTHLENTPLGAVEFDLAGRIVSWNRAAESIFGYTREEALGRTRDDFIVPASSQAHVDRILRALLRQEGGTRSTNENITKDGRAIMCDWYNTALYDRDGRLTGIVSLVEDITERLRAEAELREAKEAAEVSDRAKSDFLANMSHELRTPLNAIIGFSEVIGESLLGPVGTPRYLEYARDIRQSGLHLLQIINDLLDISKIEAGKFELRDEIVNLAELLEGTMRLVQERAEKSGLRCMLSVSADLPPLRADSRAMRQVMLNLLSNAVKFTPAGGEVRVLTGRDAVGAVTVAVADTGIGIRPEDIPRALAPFSQIDNQLSRRFEGTGLGLPLAKRLMELHGGNLDLSSLPGAGTTVTIRLPPERVVRTAIAS